MTREDARLTGGPGHGTRLTRYKEAHTSQSEEACEGVSCALRAAAARTKSVHTSRTVASSESFQGLVRLGLGLSNQRSQLVLRLVPRAARLKG